jgi:hypothetical protein
VIKQIKEFLSQPKRGVITILAVAGVSLAIRGSIHILQKMTRYHLPCTEIENTITVRLPISRAPIGCLVELKNDPIPIVYFDRCDRVIARCR